MSKLLTKDYLRKHPLIEMSAAGIMCRIMQDEAIYRDLDASIQHDDLMDAIHLSRAEADKALVASTEDIAGLFRLMRKNLAPGAKTMLYGKLLAQKDSAMPMIRERILSSFVDNFIENTSILFVRCEENYSDWLLQNFDRIRSPYAQCLMCLVLGFRGDETVASFLKTQVSRFEKEFPEEEFAQGPLLALNQLQTRFCS